MKLATRIKRLPQRQKIILGLAAFVVIAIVGILAWAAVTDLIKPKAAGVQISNTASASYQDAAGNTYTAQSNTVLVDVNPVVDTIINLTMSLQGRTNYSATGAVLNVYAAGQTTSLYSKPDIQTDTSGKSTIMPTGLNVGTSYDYRLKLNKYLTSKIASTILNANTALSFNLRAGDINNDDNVNSVDFAALSVKWGKVDAASDLNNDGIVNSIDYAFLSLNWGAKGE